MNSFYSAYQAYEHRVSRGEFDNPPERAQKPSAPPEPLLARFGDLLIQTGVRLKVRYTISKPMTWSTSLGANHENSA